MPALTLPCCAALCATPHLRPHIAGVFGFLILWFKSSFHIGSILFTKKKKQTRNNQLPNTTPCLCWMCGQQSECSSSRVQLLQEWQIPSGLCSLSLGCVDVLYGNASLGNQNSTPPATVCCPVLLFAKAACCSWGGSACRNGADPITGSVLCLVLCTWILKHVAFRFHTQ